MSTLSQQVFSNDVIVDGITSYLEQRDNAAMFSMNKTICYYILPRMWMQPILYHMNDFIQFTKFLDQSPCTHNDRTYGSMIKYMSLSQLIGRWDKLEYEHIVPIFDHCPNLEKFDIDHCTGVDEDGLVSLFTQHPDICNQIKSLDLSLNPYLRKTLVGILEQLPNLETLMLNGTIADRSVMEAISEHNPKLKWLEISRCMDIFNEDLKMIAEEFTELIHINPSGCLSARAWGPVKEINARGSWEVESDHDFEFIDTDEDSGFETFPEDEYGEDIYKSPMNFTP